MSCRSQPLAPGPRTAAQDPTLWAWLLAVLLLIGWVALPWPAAALTTASQGPPQQPGDGAVVEMLRLGVPAELREHWWAAEQESWGAWLEQQDGFLRRQLLWDPKRQEGLVLIHWASRGQWKAIPEQEVAAVQLRFEDVARRRIRAAGVAPSAGGSPFPLLMEGELHSPPGNDSPTR